MGDVRGRAFEMRWYISSACRWKAIVSFYIGLGLLLVLGAVFLTGCGGGDSAPPESKNYIPHDAINLVEGESVESYLKISSTMEGEAAVSVTNGGHLTLSDATIWKILDEESGRSTAAEAGAEDDRPERFLLAAAAFAGVYAGGGGTVSLANVSIETAIKGGNGLYASGEGSSIDLVNGTITTDGWSAHGVLATYKGTVAVENVTIITKGAYSSALATFRSAGTVTAVGGTYTAFGAYSAGIYSAGDISVTGVVCKSVSDNAAVVEGGSRITLKDSVLWAREKGGVMIFQSYSGTAPMGPSRFEMTGGSISADDGPIFYITNTTGTFLLKKVDMFGPSGILLKAMKGPWGIDAARDKPIQGGIATLVGENQILPGDIVADEFSTVVVVLKNETALTGAINTDNQGKDVRLILDASSTWEVSSDSYLTGLTFSDGISDAGITNIIGNGHTVFYGMDASPGLEGKTYSLPKGGKLMPR